jgi:hypothetical protein
MRIGMMLFPRFCVLMAGFGATDTNLYFIILLLREMSNEMRRLKSPSKFQFAPENAPTGFSSDERAYRIFEGLSCVSKFARQHFRHLFLHFRVFKPRFTASKPSVFILKLQENLLETAPVSF